MSEATQLEPVNQVRLAILRDVPAIVELGIMALKADPAPHQLIDSERIQNLARDCVYNTKNFAIVAEVNGEVVGSLCAVVQDQMVYQRKQAMVAQFYVDPEKGRGWGVKLIDAFIAWYKPMRKIKCAVFTLEHGADPRIIKLLKRKGFVSEMPLMVSWK